MVMVFVPEGGFMMGSEEDYPEENPMHGISLDSYWIDQTEVTNGMYSQCVAAGACLPPTNITSSSRTVYYGDERFDIYPVIYVDWAMAQTYCSWAGGRLPTEAEWEKAARGVDRRTYPWGNAAPSCSLANFWGTGGGCVGDTSPVGSYLFGASPYGVLDMAGNVWEWVSDWFNVRYYILSPLEIPRSGIRLGVFHPRWLLDGHRQLHPGGTPYRRFHLQHLLPRLPLRLQLVPVREICFKTRIRLMTKNHEPDFFNTYPEVSSPSPFGGVGRTPACRARMTVMLSGPPASIASCTNFLQASAGGSSFATTCSIASGMTPHKPSLHSTRISSPVNGTWTICGYDLHPPG